MALIPSKTRKGLGLKFEEGEPTTFGLERMDLGGQLAPRSFLSHELDIPTVDGKPFIFDQQATSTCVVNTFDHAIILKESRLGLPFDEPSRLFPYWVSREAHGAQWFDSGTFLYTAADAYRKMGCPSEKYWKWGQFSGRVNRRPDFRAMRMAHPRRDGKYVRIYETGQDRIQAVQQAIMSGNDVAFGTRLGQSFLSARGSAIIDPPPVTEKIAGNHAMLIIGWMYLDGKLYFRVLNSWGRNWRDGGLCWMSADYIMANYTRDLHVVYGWNRLREATAQ